MNQVEKASVFRALHQSGNPFVLANAHDVGSAKMLTALGAQAIGSTSSGYAFTQGLPDGAHVTRDQMLQHCREIVQAVDVPVSGDLEHGYAHDPQGVAECVQLAAETGMVGCALEDTIPQSDKPFYDFDHAVARMEAAVEEANALPFDFTICARADGMMIGAYDVDEAIKRLQAFEKIGAHCVYAPMPPSIDELAQICKSVSIPVNALCAGQFAKYSKQDFAKIGVARISLGSALARVTHRYVHDIGKAILDDGDFSGLLEGISGEKIERLLAAGSAKNISSSGEN